MGRECTRLTICGHIACKDCLRNALSAHIEDGVTAGALRCLHCNVEMELNEVGEFATPSQFEAYDRLLLQRSLALMSDVVRCPRPECSGTCLAENDYMARCPICRHAFCPRCLGLYHGEVPCSSRSDEAKLGDIEEDTYSRLVRYEEEDEIPLPSEGIEWMTWRLGHTPDSNYRRKLIKKILTLRSNAVGEALVSRQLKEMNFYRCPHCGVFTCYYLLLWMWQYCLEGCMYSSRPATISGALIRDELESLRCSS
ncbi:unnamed protein product [Hydatigera taeniaeformis]|uniref:RBR-type E3 ubiquitin transferase n=1 Tax=Hydatigena taeniaeformis TaxID=6205 RepID=A0A0R3WPL5_HYDTA|nr:unnamed protein product [Hydatigera taeniaeformis]